MTVYAYFTYYNPTARNRFLFILFSIFSCFSHYYATLFTGIIHLVLYISLINKDNKNWKQCVLYAVPNIFSFILWLPIFMQQLSLKQENIADKTSFFDRIVKSVIFPFYTGTHLPMKDYFVYLMSILLMIMTLSLMFLFFTNYKKRNYKNDGLFELAISIGIPISIMFILIFVGYLTKPIWYGNYITLYFPLMALGLGWVLYSYNNKKFSIMFFLVLFVCFTQKLYLQAKMCADNEYEKYVNLYNDRVILPTDVIIEANQKSSVYLNNISQYSNIDELPNNWYRFMYDNINVVDSYKPILKNRKRFFSTQIIDTQKLPYLANYTLVKEYHFEAKYYVFITTSLYLYVKNDDEI